MANSRFGMLRLAIVACVMALIAFQAAAQTEPELGVERLRAALRAAITTQRALEDENATLKAKAAEDARKVDALTVKADDAAQQLDALQKELNSHLADEQKLAQSFDAAEKDATASRAQLDQTASDLKKWQAAYEQAADVARTRDGDAKRFEAQLVETTRRVEDCSSRNAALFKIGNEVLTMYEQKGVFTSLAESEPVFQIKRVELENLIQDYQDQLLDQKITPPSH